MSEIPTMERHQLIWGGQYWVCAVCHERLLTDARYERCEQLVKLRAEQEAESQWARKEMLAGRMWVSRPGLPAKYPDELRDSDYNYSEVLCNQ